jgi:hypothetical protein
MRKPRALQFDGEIGAPRYKNEEIGQHSCPSLGGHLHHAAGKSWLTLRGARALKLYTGDTCRAWFGAFLSVSPRYYRRAVYRRMSSSLRVSRWAETEGVFSNA